MSQPPYLYSAWTDEACVTVTASHWHPQSEAQFAHQTQRTRVCVHNLDFEVFLYWQNWSKLVDNHYC